MQFEVSWRRCSRHMVCTFKLDLHCWCHQALLCFLQERPVAYCLILPKTECLTEQDLISSEFTAAEEKDTHYQVGTQCILPLQLVGPAGLFWPRCYCHQLIWCRNGGQQPRRMERREKAERGAAHRLQNPRVFSLGL